MTKGIVVAFSVVVVLSVGVNAQRSDPPSGSAPTPPPKAGAPAPHPPTIFRPPKHKSPNGKPKTDPPRGREAGPGSKDRRFTELTRL